jgi:Fe2+ transport system protein FeoA
MGVTTTPVRTVLADLEPGQAGVIDEIALPRETQQFLLRFGFSPGVEVKVSRRAPFGDPTAYRIDGAEIALRAETARHIFIVPPQSSLEKESG